MSQKKVRVRVSRKVLSARNDEEKLGLLEATQKRHVLWNNACADFMHRDKKADAWVAAAEEMYRAHLLFYSPSFLAEPTS